MRLRKKKEGARARLKDVREFRWVEKESMKMEMYDYRRMDVTRII